MRLILVEDEPFIALDLEYLVKAAGHEVAGVAESLPRALELAERVHPDAALVDINLRDGVTGPEIARRLSCEQGVAVGFLTGNADQIPSDFAGAVAVVDKPFSRQGLEELLGVLEQARAQGPPHEGQTLKFARLSPAYS